MTEIRLEVRFALMSRERIFVLVLQFDSPTLAGSATGALATKLTDTGWGGEIAEIMRGGRDDDGT